MRQCRYIYAAYVYSGRSVIGRLRKVQLSEILISGANIVFPVREQFSELFTINVELNCS